MDDQTQQPVQDNGVVQDSAPLMPEPIADGSLGSSANTPFVPTDALTSPSTDSPAFPSSDASTPVSPVLDDSPTADDIGLVDKTQQNSSDPIGSTAVDDASGGSSDLLNIKQQALQELSPLVGQLEQSPEDKFRTTMMLIQASDNQSLVQAAYDAAKAITDEKARAQALLDVVNEINYFTHNKKD